MQAVCCADREHCCPTGYQCDAEHQACTKEQDSIPMTERPRRPPTSGAPSYGAPTPVNAGTLCPGGGQCPLHAACCRTFYGPYMCCNYPTVLISFNFVVIARFFSMLYYTFLLQISNKHLLLSYLLL